MLSKMLKISVKDMNDIFKEIKDYLSLLGLKLIVTKRNFVDFVKVFFSYYSHLSFAKVDISLMSAYLFKSPYSISKHFLKERGEEDVYAYGETPLTTLDYIVRECGVSDKDTVFELGCGRGRTCFWLNKFIGCKVVGIEVIPEFVECANKIKNRYRIDGVSFRNEDMAATDLNGATCIYLYGTCLEDQFIKKLIQKLSLLPAGTKIITISYPLTDYGAQFEVMKCFPAQFTWGRGDVYLQIKK